VTQSGHSGAELSAEGVVAIRALERGIRTGTPVHTSRGQPVIAAAAAYFAGAFASSDCSRDTDRNSMLCTYQSRSTNSTSQGQAHFLMCPPHHFEVKYSINPWMDPGAWASKASCLANAADLQWRALYEALVTCGAKVEVIRAIPS
jgi:hypothetical protein